MSSWVWAVTGAAAGALSASLLSLFLLRHQRRGKVIMFRATVKPGLIEQYARHHKSVWPEVENGLRAAGVRLLSIHGPKHMSGNSENGTELCMFVELSSGVDMTRDLGPGSRYREDDRVQLWESSMCTFFQGGGWQELDVLYTLTPFSSTNTMAPLYNVDTAI